jgi:vesicle-fusing ATPase
LDRWVGGSEKLVRTLFADAESELVACNNDATKSALHVIVIDEIDAVFRKRSSAEDSGEATRSSVVNQILSKLDGVKAISNVLLIGMTNRKELLDEALLRPGRLEVQIEIPLPSKEGRREILDIHFNALRKRGRLSHPLCCAIDGVPLAEQPSVIWPINGGLSLDLAANRETDGAQVLDTTKGNRNKYPKSWIRTVFHRTVGSLGVGVFDLAADSVTGGFSGADIAGLVRCAGSLALSRARKDGYGIDGLVITLDDVKQALREVRL